jgi:hypothetical protein
MLPGDNTRGGKDMLQPIGCQCVVLWISTGFHCIYKYTWPYVYTYSIRLAPDFQERNYCIRQGVSVIILILLWYVGEIFRKFAHLFPQYILFIYISDITKESFLSPVFLLLSTLLLIALRALQRHWNKSLCVYVCVCEASHVPPPSAHHNLQIIDHSMSPWGVQTDEN